MQKKALYPIVIPLLLLTGGCAEAQTSDVESFRDLNVIQQSGESILDPLSIANSSEYAPIFDRLTILIKQEIPEEERFKYLTRYLEQIKRNDSPRRSKFKVILGLNGGEGQRLIETLPREEFSDIWSTLVNFEVRAEGLRLQKTVDELSKMTDLLVPE